MPTTCPPTKKLKTALLSIKSELALINEDALASLEEGIEEHSACIGWE